MKNPMVLLEGVSKVVPLWHSFKHGPHGKMPSIIPQESLEVWSKIPYIQVKNPTDVQDQDCKMEIVESIICGQFGYTIFEGIFILHD
jgi:hypothetical protein